MAIDPNKYKVTTSERYMPVLLLLDVSGSMRRTGKIDSLYEATVKMIETFAEAGKKEIPYKVAIITFGENVEYHTLYTDATKAFADNLPKFKARGGTPLGKALLMAKDLIEDKTITKLRWYRPAVVLVSDGKPAGGWETPLRDFISSGRTARCQRLSMGIGSGEEVRYDILQDFASEDTEKFSGTDKFCFKAEDATQVVKVFDLISRSISQSVSSNKNDFPNMQLPSSRKKTVSNTNDDYYL